MQKKNLCFALILLMAGTLQVEAHYSGQDSTYGKCFIGSPLFMIANVIPDNHPPEMVDDRWSRVFFWQAGLHFGVNL